MEEIAMNERARRLCNSESENEKISDSLEDASKRYALNNTPYEDCVDEMQEAFNAGAKWHKEKFMDKACSWLWNHTFDDNLVKSFCKNMED